MQNTFWQSGNDSKSFFKKMLIARETPPLSLLLTFVISKIWFSILVWRKSLTLNNTLEQEVPGSVICLYELLGWQLMYSADAAKWTFENSNLIVSFYPTLNSICRLCPSALSRRSLASEYSPPSPSPSSHFPISPNHPQLADKAACSADWPIHSLPPIQSSSYIEILSRHNSVITR